MAKHVRVGSRWLETLAIAVPLALVLAGQYASLSRLSEVRMFAHEFQLRAFLDQLSTDTQSTYTSLSERAVAISSSDVMARRFDSIQRHFAGAAHPAFKQLFVGVLEECSCKTQYFDPRSGALSLDTDPRIKTAVLRVSVPWRLQQGHPLEHADLLVDRQDPENRVLYRIVTDPDGRIIGVVGAVLDLHYFEAVHLPGAVARALAGLPADVRDNLVVTAATPNGRAIYSSATTAGLNDPVTSPLALAFDDLRVTVRSRTATPERLAASSLRTQMALTVLMCVVVCVGGGLAIRAERRAARLSQLKTEFVSNVTHELRTPLSSIALLAEFLRRGRVTSEAKICEYGGRIEAESCRLQQTVSNILDIARIESGQRQYAKASFEVETAVERALRTVELLMAHKGFTIGYVPPAMPLPSVVGDESAIADAVVNILDNAVKYSGASRSIEVSIEAWREYIAVSVTDYGLGIPAEEQTNIFEKFYRGRRDVSEQAVGTGLGLAIVKHAVDAHRGQVMVSSRVGSGTTVTLLIPHSEPAAPAHVTAEWQAHVAPSVRAASGV